MEEITLRPARFLLSEEFKEYIRLVRRIAHFDPLRKLWVVDPIIIRRNFTSKADAFSLIDKLRNYVDITPIMENKLKELINIALSSVVFNPSNLTIRAERPIPKTAYRELKEYVKYEGSGVFRVKSVLFLDRLCDILDKYKIGYYPSRSEIERAKKRLLRCRIVRESGDLVIKLSVSDEYVIHKLRDACTIRYFVERALFDEEGNFLETIREEKRIRLLRVLGEGRELRTSVGLIDKVIKELRTLGFQVEVEITERASLPKPLSIKFKLLPHQKIAYELWHKKKRGTIAIFTRGGKSFIAMRAIYDLKKPTLILVTTRELASTWRGYLNEYLGLNKYEIGYLGEGKKDIKPITIAIYNSCVKYIDLVKDKFELLICDECLTYDTPIITDKGQMPIGYIVENKLPIKVLTHKSRFMPILGWHKIPLAKRLTRVVLEDGTEVKCTEDHMFLTKRGWVEASKLRSEDVLYKINKENLSHLHKENNRRNLQGQLKEICKVNRIEYIPINETQDNAFVYDITVKEDHSYIANGVVVHNCHHVPANTFKNVVIKMDSLYRMALSATPKRRDGNEELLFSLCGPLIINLDYKELLALRIVAPIEIFETKFVVGEEEKLRELIKILHKHQSEKTIVFTQYISTATKIYNSLLREGFRATLITGNTPSAKRKMAFNDFLKGYTKIIVTTTVLDEGITVPDAEVAVIYEGSGEARQMIQRIGRVLGYLPGKTAKVYELVDILNPKEKKAYFRRKWVRELYMFPEVKEFVKKEKSGIREDELPKFAYQTRLDLEP